MGVVRSAPAFSYDGPTPRHRRATATRSPECALAARILHAIQWFVRFLLLALWTQGGASAEVDIDALEFRHGVSQFHDYDLKYPPDFTRFD